MKGLRVLELSEALNVDSADLLAVCAILKIKVEKWRRFFNGKNI